MILESLNLASTGPDVLRKKARGVRMRRRARVYSGTIMTPAALLPDLSSLALLAFMLGLRHGMDADHLAAIDVMARFNAGARPRVARLAGAWFSVGHGMVVLAFAFFVASLAHTWQVPAWLEPVGAWVSIGVLLVLGGLSLVSAHQATPESPVRFAGWRSVLYGRVLRVSGALPIVGVGALFAVSFDTLTQAALMGATGTSTLGLPAVGLLAGSFVAGMAVTDGLNGWFVAHLVQRSAHAAAHLSRVMAASIGGVSVATALLGIAAQLSADANAWIEDHQGRFALLIVAVVSASFAASLRLARMPVRAANLAGDEPGSLPG
jgi:high-affinity nickel-transport protein